MSNLEKNPESIWIECLALIRNDVSRLGYKTWFEPLKAIALEEDDDQVRLVVLLPSRFYYEWLEEKYFPLIRNTITAVLGPAGRVTYRIQTDVKGTDSHPPADAVTKPRRDNTSLNQAPPKKQSFQQRPFQQQYQRPAPPNQYGRQPNTAWQNLEQNRSQQNPPAANPFAMPGIRKPENTAPLNPAYTFDTFIEGDCNRLARSAAWAIAQKPGKTSFNPFLIYGGVGLGKTHLIQAIGNYVLQNEPSLSVQYISSERFTNDFVQAIQNNAAAAFSALYRQVDVLIVDDIQFLSGKEKTQEEFFHIFNSLHQSGKQIILSADRPPRDISGIEERLLSRFQWGLIADVQTPELETRTAILKQRASDKNILIEKDVLHFIASNVKTNIRELEGALNRVYAHATLHDRSLDIDLAGQVLRDIIKGAHKNLGIDEIQAIVCAYLDVSEESVRDKTRKREIVQARQIAMFFSKQLTRMSLKKIGSHFGGRDHSTVIHAIQSVKNQQETNNSYKELVAAIERKIQNGIR